MLRLRQGNSKGCQLTQLEMEGREKISSFHHPDLASCANDDHLDESELELAVQRHQNGAANTEHVGENLLLDSSKLGALKRREFFDNLLKNVDDDHLRFLQRQKERIDRHVFFAGLVKLLGLKTKRAKINVLEDVSGIIKPCSSDSICSYVCRLTLLLGPPGCGKSTLLRALAGKLDKSLKVQTVLSSFHN
ncbi:ABC transporter G family member 50 [Dichanthelium oligosanthes]|uniref:ABC transporter G family member 50 n=1 Tax=Dichanthelium oligosanthes TaxID=888268 RepID=A0A1E5UKQ6_9POAL|nr:ABC transporter G family member 50 [Dichanthelium oligosanthes]